MEKSKIYTRVGDKGETGLVSGKRISKSDVRIDLYGELDELNSRIGFSLTYCTGNSFLKETVDFLNLIQFAIFDLGSNLACEAENRIKYNLPQISNEFILLIEHEIDKMDSVLPPLKNFILPGGGKVSSSLHLCRTNARSVERKIIHYFEISKEELPANSIIFLNRLSDYFFVLARYVNMQEKIDEIEWKPRI